MEMLIAIVLGVGMVTGCLFGEPAKTLRDYVFAKSEEAIPNRGSELSAPARHLPAAQPCLEEETDSLWPKAVILDEDCFEAPALATQTNAFSVALWVKPIAPGTKTGNGGSVNGMLCSSGSGYYDGWRLTLFDWETHRPTLEIGRKEGAWNVRSTIPLSVGFWNVLVATWDGANARLYINGMIAAVQPYAGPMVPPQNPFRVGYAGFGVGSLKMAVRRVMLDDKPWTDQRVKAISRADMPGTRFIPLEGESKASPAIPLLKDPDEKRIPYCLSLIDPPTDNPFLFGMAVEQLRLMADRGVAMPSAVLIRLPELLQLDADAQRRYGIALAEAFIREGKTDQAEQIFEQMLSFVGTLPAERSPVLQRYAELLAGTGQNDKARKIYARLRDDAGLSIDIRVLSALSLAHTYMSEGNYADAITAYRQVLAVSAARPYLRDEANRCIARCERAMAGKALDDPMEERKPIAPLPKPAVTFFVAPNGNDRADGSFAHPFASLERARDAVNAKKVRGILPPGGAAVYLRGGRYAVTRTFTLSTADSGTVNAPIVYRAWQNEKPILDGGFPVKGLGKVKDPAILARLAPEAREHVYVADLKAQGFTALAPQTSYGYGKTENRTICDLYEDGAPLTLARWPNEGTLQTGAVIDPTNRIFTCAEERLSRWAEAREVMASGYWFYLWAGVTVPVSAIDPAAGRVTLGENPAYGIHAERPFFFLNLLEEIDRPGEWFLDRQTGKLYVWSLRRWAWLGNRVISRLQTPFIHATGLREVTFDGLTFEYGQQDGMVLEQCVNLTVSGCVIRRLGGSALIATKGAGLHIFGNRLHTLGHTGMRISGGDRRSLAPGRIDIENNDVGFFGRHSRTYNPALLLEGCGSRVAHNHFHDAPSSAMRIEGNDHLITFNHVERVVQESDDQGGIDMWGNPSYRGVIIRYNRWNDIGGGDAPCGQAGIRLDDAISGIVIYGNRFERTSNGNFGAVQIHGGHHNIVDNNLIRDCRYGVSFSPWGQKRWTAYIKSHTNDIYRTVNIRHEPYATRYPELANINRHPDFNNIWRNGFIGTGAPFRNAPSDCDRWANFNVAAGTDESALPATATRAPLPAPSLIGPYPHPRNAKEE